MKLRTLFIMASYAIVVSAEDSNSVEYLIEDLTSDQSFGKELDHVKRKIDKPTTTSSTTTTTTTTAPASKTPIVETTSTTSRTTPTTQSTAESTTTTTATTTTTTTTTTMLSTTTPTTTTTEAPDPMRSVVGIIMQCFICSISDNTTALRGDQPERIPNMRQSNGRVPTAVSTQIYF